MNTRSLEEYKREQLRLMEEEIAQSIKIIIEARKRQYQEQQQIQAKIITFPDRPRPDNVNQDR